MKRLTLVVISCLLVGFVFLSPMQTQAASVVCPDLSFLAATYPFGQGRTVLRNFEAGTRVEISASLGTATGAVMRVGFSPTFFTYDRDIAVPGTAVIDITQATTTLWLSVENPNAGSNGTIVVNVTCGPITAGNPPHLLDGRINRDPTHDLAAPVVIYGPLDIYAVNPQTSQGDLVIRLSQSEIDTVGVPSDSNVILAEGTNPFTGQPITVFRLTNGSIQVNTFYADGKPYIFGWSPDNPNNNYHAAP